MIRKAKLSEIHEIIIITQACASKMMSEGIYQWNEHYPNKEAFFKDVERGELFVLLFENVIIGCVAITSEKDVEYDAIEWLTEDGFNYYIHRLAIHPDFQKKGYAQKLMNFAEDYAKKNNFTSIRLDTFSQNHRNQKFYEARGYTRLGDIFFPKQSEYPFYCYEKVL